MSELHEHKHHSLHPGRAMFFLLHWRRAPPNVCSIEQNEFCMKRLHCLQQAHVVTQDAEELQRIQELPKTDNNSIIKN